MSDTVILLVILFIFMALSFLAGCWAALWWTDPRHIREKSDKKWAREYDSNNWW